MAWMHSQMEWYASAMSWDGRTGASGSIDTRDTYEGIVN